MKRRRPARGTRRVSLNDIQRPYLHLRWIAHPARVGILPPASMRDSHSRGRIANSIKGGHMHYVRLAAGLILVAACTSTDQPTVPRAHPDALAALSEGSSGAVYTQSNAVAGNAVLAYRRAPDGSLTPAGSFATGGAGTGAGLGSQGAVVLSNNGRYLLAVNAGSNELSSFAVEGGGALILRNTVGSGGTMPISVTIAGRLVYVLNAGGTGNISGFRLANDGSLSAIAGSSRPLSSNAAGPAQIQFARQGRVLVVTEKNTNVIGTYLVGEGGLASGPQVHASSAPLRSDLRCRIPAY